MFVSHKCINVTKQLIFLCSCMLQTTNVYTDRMLPDKMVVQQTNFKCSSLTFLSPYSEANSSCVCCIFNCSMMRCSSALSVIDFVILNSDYVTKTLCFIIFFYCAGLPNCFIADYFCSRDCENGLRHQTFAPCHLPSPEQERAR